MRRLIWLLTAVVFLAFISTSVYADVVNPDGSAKNQEEALPGGQSNSQPEQQQPEQTQPEQQQPEQTQSEQPQPEQPQPGQQTEPRSDKAYILSLVNPIEVDAVMKTGCKLYSDQSMKKYLKTIPKGEKIKFLRDKDQKSAFIKLKNGVTGWVPYKYLTISKMVYINTKLITDEQKTLYVNYKGYASSTKYLIWVNVERQQVNVFIGSKGKWKPRS
jgi:hypothetical protein